MLCLHIQDGENGISRSELLRILHVTKPLDGVGGHRLFDHGNAPRITFCFFAKLPVWTGRSGERLWNIVVDFDGKAITTDGDIIHMHGLRWGWRFLCSVISRQVFFFPCFALDFLHLAIDTWEDSRDHISPEGEKDMGNPWAARLFTG